MLWLIVLLSAFSWMISSRIVRGMTMSLREREFVSAARYMGVSNRRIIIRHILPNVASILIIDTALNVGIAILAETGLSFLGFGVQPPDVSLGTLIADGTRSVTTFPWVFLFPAGVLVLIVLCANLIGDGLRDALDPAARPAATRGGAAPMTLLEVRDLRVDVPHRHRGTVAAVRGLNYHVDSGEVVALVGESGAGKSAGAMAVIGLLPEFAEVSGSVRLQGDELIGLPDAQMSRIRGDRIGTVFQDPMSALTPVYTVGDQIAEAIRIHQRDIGARQARARADRTARTRRHRPARAARPGVPARSCPAARRQRVVIAIAIANDPDLLICDEPTTALDVTVQAQILDVLRTARDVTGAGVLIITHDLGVVAEFADRALVMYAGRAGRNCAGRGRCTATAECPTPQGCSDRCPASTRPGANAWCPSRVLPVAGGAAAGLPVHPALPAGHRRVPAPPNRNSSPWAPPTQVGLHQQRSGRRP